jgi:metallo-beta-lactamase family protein
MVVTHAHLDHIGWIPRLVQKGFRGPIYATPATIALTRVSLLDSAHIQEEDAKHANKHGTRHNPALPLYTMDDVPPCLRLMQSVHYEVDHSLPGGANFRFVPAGHILGSAMAKITLPNGELLLMSGDLGRYNTPIIRDPAVVTHADYLVIESTYGNRVHSHEDVIGKLETILNEAYENKSVVLVPSFSIGRTQELLYYVKKIQEAGKMPKMRVYVDSPMAISVTEMYRTCKEEMDDDMLISLKEGNSELEPDGVFYTRDSQDSRALNTQGGPMMIIAGSGMANGGRIVHHLLHHLSDPSTIVLFTGYQAEGTMGRRLLDGSPTVRILGQELNVRARIDRLNALSAHADQVEILKWLDGFEAPPKRTFIVHGEPDAQAALQDKIRTEKGWDTVIPKQAQEFQLP